MPAPDFGQFEEFAAARMEKHHICGLAVSVKKKGETIFELCLGVRDLPSQSPVTPDTVFGIASVSKSFTAMSVMQLADAGTLCPDDPVAKHLPEFRIRGVEDINAVKIHHLLSHSTGLPPFRRRQGEFPLISQHVEYVGSAEYELLGQPGEYFSYCNDAFIVLGAVIERVTNKHFRDYVRENLFVPIGMSRSSHSPDDLSRYGDDITSLYVYNSNTGQHEPQIWPDLGTYHVSGGIRSSMRDLSRYASLYTLGGVIDGNRVVSEHAIRRMRQPVVPVGRNSYYGFGLQTTLDYCGVSLVSHGGSLPGVSSHFGYVPETGVSACVLTNVSAVPAKSLWLGAINAALGLPVNQECFPETHWDAPEGYLDRYIGTYSSLEGGKFRVFKDSGKLMAEQRGETIVLMASDKDRLYGTLGGQEFVVKFFSREDGTVWAALAGSRMLRKEKE